MFVQWESDEPLVRFWYDEGQYQLDVRSVQAAGGHPEAHVLSCVKRIGRGDVLVIHTPSEPKPLIAELKDRGLSCDARAESDDHWVLVVRQ